MHRDQAGLNYGFASFAGANPNDFFDAGHEDLSVPDLANLGRTDKPLACNVLERR
jgi:hypothetical protein